MLSRNVKRFANKKFYFLLILLLIAIGLRFIYFPGNIYFGFDQARDAYAALEILRGDFKIVGPSTSAPGLYHGVLYYYLIAPFYFLGSLNPEFVSGALKIFNTLGLFLMFYISEILFNKKIALLAALLYAISFEQTQFSIYMGNPTLAVLSVLLMYTGLAMVIFKKNHWGLILAVLGLGFSIQFQFALIYLILPFIGILTIFRKNFLELPAKIWGLSICFLLFSLSTFILAEIKYGFRTLHTLIVFGGGEKQLDNILKTYFFSLQKMVHYNLISNLFFQNLTLLSLLLSFIFYLKAYKRQLTFLGIWFFSISTTVFISGGVENIENNVPLYYTNIGVTLSLLIFTALLLYIIFTKSKVFGVLILTIIIFSNLYLVKTLNQMGTISEINVQQGMLLSDEKKVLDYMYNESDGQLFAVKGVTMPFFVNTTWSYLFESYGNKKYGYLPIWNGKNALGYYGNLKAQETQEGLPDKRFLIVEPTRGVPQYLIGEYLKEENYFTKVIEEKKIGEFIIQKRIKF